jgi:hypothetical protein
MFLNRQTLIAELFPHAGAPATKRMPFKEHAMSDRTHCMKRLPLCIRQTCLTLPNRQLRQKTLISI